MANEPVLESAPGRSLLDQIERLTAAVSALVDINRALCRKIEANETKLTVVAKFVADNSSTRATFEVL